MNAPATEALFNATSDGVLLLDSSKQIVRANDAAGRILELDAEAIRGRSLESLSLVELSHRLDHGNTDQEEIHHLGDLDQPSLLIRTIPVEGPGWLVLFRKPKSSGLTSEEIRILDESFVGLFVLNQDGAFVYDNYAHASIFGYSPSEVIGKLSWQDLTYPDDREMLARRIEERLRGNLVREPTSFRGLKENGESVDVEAYGWSIVYNNQPAFIGTLVDITDRIETQAQLIQADKMATLGTLVSGVAHEINNPNHYISSNIGPLKDAWRDALRVLDLYHKERGDFACGRLSYSERRDQIPRMLESIQEGSSRIKTIVEELREYTQQRPSTTNGPVDLNQVVESAVQLVSSHTKKATRRFSVQRNGQVPIIHANGQRLQQVVVNLILNACQAVKSEETAIRVSTTFDRAEERIFLEVADEGIGIPAENLPHLTDPFFTTKRTSGGTGLGLSISSRIVEEHRGTIRFESAPEQGTVVTVALPASPDVKK